MYVLGNLQSFQNVLICVSYMYFSVNIFIPKSSATRSNYESGYGVMVLRNKLATESLQHDIVV